ncbi:hypothetical protein PCASD_06388 [Puccinia coronata f. sp. avenae]|uniref:Uncharacterized protein n=1 Tax=Puccinia coronata f. sp. avenae TaxID=200324 RepID=A0A2N5UX92_9BASI|nr:hypothetical protein PCASD_06388 [Puccinia coronata f. sp. avenae]
MPLPSQKLNIKKPSTSVKPSRQNNAAHTHALVIPQNHDGVVISGFALSKKPGDLIQTKEALCTHIRVLWGLHPRQIPPPAPLGETLCKFYHQFETVKQIKDLAENICSATAIIPPNEVQALKDA